jgi:hypothetical protein
MSASTVGLWEQAVKLLQDGTKDLASCSDPSLWTRVDAVLVKLINPVPPPKAILKKLLQQRQVCPDTKQQHVGWVAVHCYGAACVQLLSRVMSFSPVTRHL